jgi:LL-diaminopimelate aminotransferase
MEFFSLSKSFSMTGWRLGWAAAAQPFIAALTRVKSYVDTGPWLAVQQAGAYALDHADRLMAPNVAELARRRDVGIGALSEAGFSCESPRATMYLWVPLPAGIPSAEFARRALEEQGVVVLPGSAFGAGGEGFFRIALTVGCERLVEGIQRLGRVLRSSRAA